MIWLNRDAAARLKLISLYFPVREHSFMPANRVFGRVEKLLRSHAVIKSPEKYWEIYPQIGTVRKLGTDWIMYDYK